MTAPPPLLLPLPTTSPLLPLVLAVWLLLVLLLRHLIRRR
jgi:hypothetical protein